jgi:hypothetical protein
MTAAATNESHESTDDGVTSVRALEQSAAACLAWLPAESLERLAHYTTPAAIRQRRFDERDRLYHELVAGLPRQNRRRLARMLIDEVDRYRRGRWRFERGQPAPAAPRLARIHRILTLGKPMEFENLRKWLGEYSAAVFIQNICQDSDWKSFVEGDSARRGGSRK